jgi:purine-nucleoside phosphorylase
VASAAPRQAWLGETCAHARASLALADGKPPVVGVILGSGLGPFADELEEARSIPTAELPHFPTSTVAGHAGRLVAGSVGGVRALVLKGRVHEYEGYSFGEITTGVRVMAALGVRGLFLTNAAGSVRRELSPGSILLVRDHVRPGFDAVLRSARSRELAEGVAFGRATTPGVETGPYSERLQAITREAARELRIGLEEGRLVYSRGPSYETAAEVRWYRWMGGHAACMSTVSEAIAGRLLGCEVVALSCITNYGTGLSRSELTHDEVTTIANQVSGDFRRLLTETIRRAYA